MLILSPIFKRLFTCTFHQDGEYAANGDALGVDCHVASLAEGHLTLYRGLGLKNEDWHSFGEPVYSPLSGIVTAVRLPSGVNTMPDMGKTEVGNIWIKREGVEVCVGHLDGIVVTVGSAIRAGDRIGLCSNNGWSRSPHIHVGAVSNGIPTQVHFCQVAGGCDAKAVGFEAYCGLNSKDI